MRKHVLHRLFEPKSVALVGASEKPGSVGRQVLQNLVSGEFKGDIYPVNRNYETILGLPGYPTIGDIDHTIDLVVMAIPAKDIPEVMRQCGERQVGAVVIISAGFGEVGPVGLALQNELVDLARTFQIPMVGPNCLGVMRPEVGLNATFAKSGAASGQVALVAQSGAFCTALLDWADSRGFGFSAVASLGETADVGFGEVLDFLAVDPNTRSILLYIESISDARAFISGLRVAARLKPVVIVKAGRNTTGSHAAVTHTGGEFGSDAVFDAALQRAGAVRVTTVNQLFAAAHTLASNTRVKGGRLAVVTNGGGPGVMAADHAADLDVPIAELGEPTIKALAEALPDHWSHSDPVDILGDADGDRYEQAVRLVLADKNVDGVLVLLAPQGMTDPTACAEAVVRAAAESRKPVLASWMGEKQVREGRERLGAAGIPNFSSPEAGVDAFGYLAAYHRNQSKLLQAPTPLSEHREPDVDGARMIIQDVIDERRSVLSNTEARAVIKAFRIPVAPSINVNSPADALVAAETLGLPVAMKINSPDISHKSDVGGVRLNLREPRSVRSAYREMIDEVSARVPEASISGVTVEPMMERPHAREVMVGISRDPVFGPVVSFGAGGTTMDINADTEVALPPLNVYLCKELIHRTRAERALKRIRQLPEADLKGVIDVLMRVSEMACELPEIEELVINPILVDEDSAVAVDAWLSVAPPRTSTAHYGHMAIHPYPSGLETAWQTHDGMEIVVRPIRPEDARIEQTFVDGLSPESKYFRFMYRMGDISPTMLARFTQIDYDREMALVAVENEGDDDARLLGVARYVGNPDGQSCEFALTVADDMQRKGIGRQLMHMLMNVARDRGLSIMEGDVLAQNRKMLRLCEKLGFRVARNPADPEVVVVRRHL
jgi:acetyltransferase